MQVGQSPLSQTHTFFVPPGLILVLKPLPAMQHTSDDGISAPQWANVSNFNAVSAVFWLSTFVTLFTTFPLLRMRTVTSVPVPLGTFMGLAGLLGPQVMEFCLFWTEMVLVTDELALKSGVLRGK